MFSLIHRSDKFHYMNEAVTALPEHFTFEKQNFIKSTYLVTFEFLLHKGIKYL